MSLKKDDMERSCDGMGALYITKDKRTARNRRRRKGECLIALTRKFLSALGIEADKIDEIITAHTETVDALKEQRDTYKADAEKLPGVQKELDDLKAAAGDGKENPYEKKYNDLKQEYDDYKADVTAKETAAKKAAAYRALLKEVGVSEKRLDAVLKVTGMDGIELDDKGGIKDAAKLKDSIKTEWADFIVKTGKKGADVNTPPEGGNHAAKSREEIYAKDDRGRYKLDATARQQALANLRDAGEE